jgi:hypothetical protein
MKKNNEISFRKEDNTKHRTSEFKNMANININLSDRISQKNAIEILSTRISKYGFAEL